MKIAIIYTTTNKSTKKSCKILESKLNCDVQLIPIKIAKQDCLLKYNFVIFAASNNNGKVQGEFKRYISRNIKTIKEIPKALIINSENEAMIKKTYSDEILNSSYICSNFGYELDESNFIEKRKINRLNKNGEKLPELNIDEINKFADYINNMIEKRVD